MTRLRAACHFIAVALLASVGVPSASAAEVTIYRCTDAKGQLTLRDTPCRKDEKQQTREMLRPQDPPPRAVIKTAPRSTPERTTGETRVVMVTPPRPMYECTSPDGERYYAENAEGNPRWVPLWTLGFPVWQAPAPVTFGVRGQLAVQRRNTTARVEFGDRNPSVHAMPPPAQVVMPAYPAATWVRDACHALPQEEVCDRLRDRRWELDRRYNSALQSEREQITREQRGIDARLNNDCGAY